MWAPRSWTVAESAEPKYELRSAHTHGLRWLRRAVAAAFISLPLTWSPAAQGAEAPSGSSDSTGQPAVTADVADSVDAGSAAALTASGEDGTGSGSAPDRERTIYSNAGFSDSIPIAVPPFHGVEPSLALRYDSGAGNGFVGVGWRLSGLSVIERASVRFGAPRYDDATDVFLLDGDELVSCAQA